MPSAPQVSVIIPSYGRPAIVARTVQAVLSEQTLDNIEVVVALDGSQPDSEAALARIQDPRLRVWIAVEKPGANGCRNQAVQLARAPWVAFLDDDDSWLPTKLERQLAVAEASRFPHPVVACQVIHRTPRADVLLPRRRPRPLEHLSEYLFVRSGLTHGEGLMQTSSLFTRRTLVRQVPWNPTAVHMHEADWLLHAFCQPGVGLELLMEPLSIWEAPEDRPRLSLDREHWTRLRSWAQSIKTLVTPQAYAAMLLTIVSDMIGPNLHGQSWLLQSACRCGSPRLLDLALWLGINLIPQARRRALRDRLDGRKTGND